VDLWVRRASHSHSSASKTTFTDPACHTRLTRRGGLCRGRTPQPSAVQAPPSAHARHRRGPAGPVLWWENTSGSVLIGGIQGPYSSCPTATPLTVGVITGNRLVVLPVMTGLPEVSIRSFAW
jgi:hypothetical protein